VHPAIGADATGAGWVYEYALVDRSHFHSLADLRTLQDRYLRYQLEAVLAVAANRYQDPAGIKIQGPDLARIQEFGARMQQILSGLPETTSVYAERVAQGFYLNAEVNRPQAARYGLTVADVQQVITSEIGGAESPYRPHA
jgi:Cu/Ag efflux pump CusA